MEMIRSCFARSACTSAPNAKLSWCQLTEMPPVGSAAVAGSLGKNFVPKMSSCGLPSSSATSGSTDGCRAISLNARSQVLTPWTLCKKPGTVSPS